MLYPVTRVSLWEHYSYDYLKDASSRVEKNSILSQRNVLAEWLTDVGLD